MNKDKENKSKKMPGKAQINKKNPGGYLHYADAMFLQVLNRIKLDRL